MLVPSYPTKFQLKLGMTTDRVEIDFTFSVLKSESLTNTYVPYLMGMNNGAPISLTFTYMIFFSNFIYLKYFPKSLSNNPMKITF